MDRGKQIHSVIGYIRLAFGAVLFSAILLNIDLAALANALQTLGVISILGWAILVIIARVPASLALFFTFRTLKANATLGSLFWIGCIRTFLNQFVLFSGAIYYLLSVRFELSIPWDKLVASTILQASAILVVAGCMGLLGFSILNPDNAEAPILLLTLCTILPIVFHAAALSRRISTFVPLSPFILNVQTRVAELVWNVNTVVKCTLLHALATLLRTARFYILFLAFGIELSVPEILILAALTEVATIIQITPGALGVREGAIIYFGWIIDLSTGIASAIGVIDRILIIFTNSILGALGFLALRDR